MELDKDGWLFLFAALGALAAVFTIVKFSIEYPLFSFLYRMVKLLLVQLLGVFTGLIFALLASVILMFAADYYSVPYFSDYEEYIYLVIISISAILSIAMINILGPLVFTFSAFAITILPFLYTGTILFLFQVIAIPLQFVFPDTFQFHWKAMGAAMLVLAISQILVEGLTNLRAFLNIESDVLDYIEKEILFSDNGKYSRKK